MSLLRLITFRQQPEEELPIPSNGLILYLDAANPTSYPGTGTTWFDLSGNGYDHTLVGSPTFTGDAFVFDVNTKYAELNGSTIANNFGSNEITVFATVSRSGLVQKPSIFTYINSPRPMFNAPGNRLGTTTQNYWDASGNGWIAGTNTSWTLNDWYGYAWTASGTSLNMYYNLQQNTYISNGSFTLTNSVNLAPGANILIGKENGGNFNSLTGSLGAVVVYNRVLSSAELTQLFTYFSRP